jgi:predicted ATPase
MGKFDPLQRPEPYVGFVSAFAQFVPQVLQHGAVPAVRTALIKAGVSDKDWPVLAGMIPNLHQIFRDEEECTGGREDESSALGNRQLVGGLRRFAYFLSLFLRAISSLKVPVMLLLDDLQHADQSALQILANIVEDLTNCPSLFVIFTHDRSEGNKCGWVDTQEALEKMIGETGGNHFLRRIAVGNLDREDVVLFLSDALDLSCFQTAAELGSLVFDQTKGNIFYVLEFVKHLLQNNWLHLSDPGWRLDVQPIKASWVSCPLSEFLMLKLRALSPELQQLLMVASCCGTYVPVSVLQSAYGEATIRLLQEASALDLLTTDHGTHVYKFAHDIIQQSVYKEMIPRDEREQFHLAIGRRMRNGIVSADLERSLFVLISQFYFAKHLVTEQKEQKEACSIALLCLMAGRKAAASSNFQTACVYLNLGIEFLGEFGWKDHYDLTLTLYNAAAEMHICDVDFDATERLVAVVLKKARPSDRVQAETTLVYAVGMKNKQNEAIDLGIQLLARLGEPLPRRLRKARLLIETVRVYGQLIGKSDEQLLCLPAMADPEKLACIQILNLLFLHATLVRPLLTPFVVLKFTSLTLKYGQCLMSPIAFAAYGLILSHMGQIDEAYRFGRLAVKMLERSGHDESLPRVYALFYGSIFILKRPKSEAIAKLHEGYRVGLQTGDFEFACLNATIYVYLSMEAGMPLPLVDKEYARIRSVMMGLGQETMLNFVLPTAQAGRHYMGLTQDALGSKGDLLDYEEAYQRSLQINQESMVIGITVHRLILFCVFNDFAGAEQQATRCIDSIDKMPTLDHKAVTLFYLAIVYMENGANSSGRKVLRMTRRATSLLKKLSMNSPINYGPMRLLLDAEVAAAKRGQEMVARELYSFAIACARSSSCLLMEAFGNERCGRFLYKVNCQEEARPFFEESCRAYEKWGAMAKVIRLEQEMRSTWFATKTTLSGV